MEWHHSILIHPDCDCMEGSICSMYTWKGLRSNVIQHWKTCDIYQHYKRTGKKKYSLLPEKEGEVTKWSRVNVDLWGLKTLKNKKSWKYKIHVMTMVDPVTWWLEQTQLYGKPTASCCQRIFDTTWLARYPRAREIWFDNGGELKLEFKEHVRIWD